MVYISLRNLLEISWKFAKVKKLNLNYSGPFEIKKLYLLFRGWSIRSAAVKLSYIILKSRLAWSWNLFLMPSLLHDMRLSCAGAQTPAALIGNWNTVVWLCLSHFACFLLTASGLCSNTVFIFQLAHWTDSSEILEFWKVCSLPAPSFNLNSQWFWQISAVSHTNGKMLLTVLNHPWKHSFVRWPVCSVHVNGPHGKSRA